MLHQRDKYITCYVTEKHQNTKWPTWTWRENVKEVESYCEAIGASKSCFSTFHPPDVDVKTTELSLRRTASLWWVCIVTCRSRTLILCYRTWNHIRANNVNAVCVTWIRKPGLSLCGLWRPQSKTQAALWALGASLSAPRPLFCLLTSHLKISEAVFVKHLLPAANVHKLSGVFAGVVVATSNTTMDYSNSGWLKENENPASWSFNNKFNYQYSHAVNKHVSLCFGTNHFLHRWQYWQCFWSAELCEDYSRTQQETHEFLFTFIYFISRLFFLLDLISGEAPSVPVVVDSAAVNMYSLGVLGVDLSSFLLCLLDCFFSYVV